MFVMIINNCLKEIKTGKKITEKEFLDLLLRTLSFLPNVNTDSILNGTNCYLVNPYAQTAAGFAKGQIPDEKEGKLVMHLDLAIAAAMEMLNQNTDNPAKFFPNRLAAAVNALIRITGLPADKTGDALCGELVMALSYWLDSFAEEKQESGERSLKAAETER